VEAWVWRIATGIARSLPSRADEVRKPIDADDVNAVLPPLNIRSEMEADDRDDEARAGLSSDAPRCVLGARQITRPKRPALRLDQECTCRPADDVVDIPRQDALEIVQNRVALAHE
jgi:hypothetical protein